jgi:hypothetical protein
MVDFEDAEGKCKRGKWSSSKAKDLGAALRRFLLTAIKGFADTDNETIKGKCRPFALRTRFAFLFPTGLQQ